MMQSIEKVIHTHIKRKKILVVGDVMLDCYFRGSVDRISPEAPVPIFVKRDESYVLGGAANVAANLACANQEVYVASVLGKDIAGRELVDLLEKSACCTEGIIISGSRQTTIKTRVVANGNQQLLRVDEENCSLISKSEEEDLTHYIDKILMDVDVVVLSDYAKGVLTTSLCSWLISRCRELEKPTLVDVKENDPAKYKGATLIKPNQKELAWLTDSKINCLNDVQIAAKYLLKLVDARFVLVTLGAQGMLLVGKNGIRYFCAKEREVFDVSGAGDTAIAYLAACIANRVSIVDSVQIANCASGIKVSKAGTAPVLLSEVNDELQTEVEDCMANVVNKKLISSSLLKRRCEQLREDGRRIVFTNGCFDILHAGHVAYLKKAASYGDILVVGLNSDSSIQRLKGSERPINNQEDRAVVLSALDCVDYVSIFEEDTPENLIHCVMPDVLVKGGDYKGENVIGAKFVESIGGKVEITPFLEGHSTTQTINKIRNWQRSDDCD